MRRRNYLISCFQIDFYLCLWLYFPFFFSNVSFYSLILQFCCIWFCLVLQIQFSQLSWDILSHGKEICNFLFSYQCSTSGWVLFVNIFLIFWPFIFSIVNKRCLQIYLVSLATVHMGYICAFAHSEVFQKMAEDWVGSHAISFRRQWVKGKQCYSIRTKSVLEKYWSIIYSECKQITKMDSWNSFIPYHRKYMQPIQTHESQCIFDSITSNCPIVRCTYVALIVLASVIFLAWFKRVMQLSLEVHHAISNLTLVCSC